LTCPWCHDSAPYPGLVDKEVIRQLKDKAEFLEAKIETSVPKVEPQIPKEHEELLKKLEELDLDKNLLKEVQSQLSKKKEKEDEGYWGTSKKCQKYKKEQPEEEVVFKSANGSFSDKKEAEAQKREFYPSQYFAQSPLRQEEQSPYVGGCSRHELFAARGKGESHGPMTTLGKGATEVAKGNGFHAVEGPNHPQRVVFLSRTGKCYHFREGCRNAFLASTLESALSMGKVACTICSANHL